MGHNVQLERVVQDAVYLRDVVLWRAFHTTPNVDVLIIASSILAYTQVVALESEVSWSEVAEKEAHHGKRFLRWLVEFAVADTEDSGFSGAL